MIDVLGPHSDPKVTFLDPVLSHSMPNGARTRAVHA